MAETLTQEQALSVLISAARVSQSKGAFTLEDAVLVSKAIATFTPADTGTTTLPSENEDKADDATEVEDEAGE